MIRKLLLPFFFLFSAKITAQPPVLYINIVSHNETGDNLQNTSQFNAMNPKVLQLAAIIDAKGASWNLQTCDGYPTAALNLQGASANIFKTLTTAPYDDNIEIDPRPKTVLSSAINIADTYHMLDSLGCHPTHTLGGFVYSTIDSAASPIDWFRYQDTVTGIVYSRSKWKAELMWGAGSYRPHTNDLNDYGIWKPDAVSYTNTQAAFYNHNPSRTVWFIGNGCQPLQGLDSTENVQVIISDLHNFINQLQDSTLPQDKFYCYTVTINQSHFGPTLFQMVTTLCDSVNSWGTSKIQWKKLSEKFALFQTWQTTASQSYSQFLCGQMATGIEQKKLEDFDVYPNPSNGIIHLRFTSALPRHVWIYNAVGELIAAIYTEKDNFSYDLSTKPKGIYLVKTDREVEKKIIRE